MNNEWQVTSVEGHAVQHVLMFQVLTMMMIKMMPPKIMPITKMAPCQIEISDAVGQGGGISLVPRRQSQHVARGHLGHSHILMFTNKCIWTKEYFEQMVFGPSVIIWRCTNLPTFDTLITEYLHCSTYCDTDVYMWHYYFKLISSLQYILYCVSRLPDLNSRQLFKALGKAQW